MFYGLEIGRGEHSAHFFVFFTLTTCDNTEKACDYDAVGGKVPRLVSFATAHGRRSIVVPVSRPRRG